MTVLLFICWLVGTGFVAENIFERDQYPDRAYYYFVALFWPIFAIILILIGTFWYLRYWFDRARGINRDCY